MRGMCMIFSSRPDLKLTLNKHCDWFNYLLLLLADTDCGEDWFNYSASPILNFQLLPLRIHVNFSFRQTTQTGLLSHKKAWTSTVFPAPNCTFHVFKRVVCFPARQCSFPDRKSLQGLSPHHRWPFNTSLATANEPGVAAAWLDPADFAQMFMSHSPAVLGWEVHFNLGSIFTLFIYFYLFVTGSWRFEFSLEDSASLCSCDAAFYFLIPCWTNTI